MYLFQEIEYISIHAAARPPSNAAEFPEDIVCQTSYRGSYSLTIPSSTQTSEKQAFLLRPWMIIFNTYSFCHSRIVHLVPKKNDKWKIKKQKRKIKEWKKSFIHLTLVKGHDIVFRWNDHECKSRKKRKLFLYLHYLKEWTRHCRSSNEISIKQKKKKKKKKFKIFFSHILDLKNGLDIFYVLRF